MVSATLEHVHTPFGEREILLHGFRKAIEKFRSCAEEKSNAGCESPITAIMCQVSVF
jgi:hypothetical protein